MRHRYLLTILAAALFALPVTALAATPARTHRAAFNAKNIVTVSGTVYSMHPTRIKAGVAKPVTLSLKTSSETLPVLVGPASYVARQKFQIHKGEELSVTGSRVMQNRRPEIIATKITKGGQELKLRTDEGKPLWAAPRHAHRSMKH